MQNTSIGIGDKDSKQSTAKELATMLVDNVTIRGLFSETIQVVSVPLVVYLHLLQMLKGLSVC